ncbi:MAG: hypothetical protein HYV63_09885 [Candidatus Schekmanbacteria bacterium]|nr:hypothetical protein [Candidatus Schekmanbacteria bacterium]
MSKTSENDANDELVPKPGSFVPANGLWWLHESYSLTDGDVLLEGSSLLDLAALHGTPLYVYSTATIQRQLQRLGNALSSAAAAHRIFYAMKANRHPDILAAALKVAGVGLDTCSPREVQLALACGCPREAISFNAGMLSDRDLRYLAEQQVHCTLDTFSALRRYGRVAAPGTSIGLRFDPGVRASYGGDPRMSYGQAKFGFDPDQAAAAIAEAARVGLAVDTVHMHLGWGLPGESRGLMAAAFARLAAIAAAFPQVRAVNVGGGLGGRYVESDRPILVPEWADIIATAFGPLGVEVCCEPGTFVAAPAGILLVEVNTVERRRGHDWLGVDAGSAVNVNSALYGIPLTALLLRAATAPPTHRYAIGGNINEAGDVWGYDVRLPEAREGDILAFLPAGAYGASMSSDHCLRGQAKQVVVSA